MTDNGPSSRTASDHVVDGSALRVSDLGFDATDATATLQAALDSTADVVVIDDVGADWITGPLFVRRSNLTVLVEPGVTVRALPGGFPEVNDCLLTVEDQHDIRISGYGATFAMNKAEYTDGEWRMTLKLRGVADTVVEGLTLRDSGGDGVYLGRSEVTRLSRDVVLRDLVCDNNARQGLSVVSVDGLRVEGCAFVRSNGTPPQTGIQLHPNFADEQLTDVLIVDCVSEGNWASGVQLVGGALNHDSAPLSVRVVRSTIGTQGGGNPQVMVGSDDDMFSGSLEIQQSVIRTRVDASALAMISRELGGPGLRRARTSQWDWGTAEDSQPILWLSRGNPSSGHLTVTDSALVVEAAPGPAAPRPPEPAGSVEIRTSASTVRGGRPAVLTFTRVDADDLGQPVAVPYTTSGTARERYDYGGLGRAVVIPSGQRETSITIRTFPRRRPSDPRIRTVVFSLGEAAERPGPDGGSVSIQIQG